MLGQIVKDWTKLDLDSMAGKKAAFEALQFFYAIPDKFTPPRYKGSDELSKKFKEKREGFEKARLQYFATLNDFPATPKDVVDKFHALPVFDNGYEQIFDVRDYGGSRKDGFAVDNVQSGLTFRRIKTGEKAYVHQMSGDRYHVFFDYYGGALGWHRSLFENQDYWTLEENAIEFRNEAYRIRAATFYALVEAAANGKAAIAWQPPTPPALANTDPIYEAVRDANTMNFAAQTILLACQAKGYGISAQNVNFIILAPIQLRARVKRALGVTPSLLGGRLPQIDYNFMPIITTMLATTNQYHVILPKKHFKAGYRMDLTTFTDFDILSYTDTVAGWMAFGGAVGDTDQIERCAIA